MSNNTQSYYEYRASKARILADAAVDPKIAAIHLEMAERYDLLAGEPYDTRDMAPISDLPVPDLKTA